MDCSRVIQNFDSLWFYTNIIVADDSFTDDQTSEANDDAPFPLNQKNDDEPKKVIEISSSMIPRFCAKCGRVSNDSKADEIVKSKSNDNCDDDEVLMKSRREREKKKKKETKKRRKKNRRGVHGIQQQIEKMLPPFDDDVAMKEHLKLWAYAVGCTMHCQMKQFTMKCD